MTYYNGLLNKFDIYSEIELVLFCSSSMQVKWGTDVNGRFMFCFVVFVLLAVVVSTGFNQIFTINMHTVAIVSTTSASLVYHSEAFEWSFSFGGKTKIESIKLQYLLNYGFAKIVSQLNRILCHFRNSNVIGWENTEMVRFMLCEKTCANRSLSIDRCLPSQKFVC